MNGCEPQQLRMLYLANRSSMDWTLGSPFAIDLVVSAAEQLNDSVMPFTTNEDVRKQTRYQCFMRGKARSDISRWVAAPGQGVWLHIANSKANMGEVKAKAAIFCYPLRGGRGFVVRTLESRHLMVVYSISVINDRALRHSRVLASDDLRNTYGFTPRVNRELASGVRDMLAAQPGFGIDALVRLDPLVPGGVPVQLEEVRSDSFGGEKTLGRPITKFSAEVDAPADAAPHP
jgi:hypothetical protein